LDKYHAAGASEWAGVLSSISVYVAVMNVGKMGVRVGDWQVLMGMGMRLLAVIFEVVNVLMVCVVTVPVVVAQHLMSVGVFVPLTDMRPDSQDHQWRRDPNK
jgi:hypothetical protein